MEPEVQHDGERGGRGGDVDCGRACHEAMSDMSSDEVRTLEGFWVEGKGKRKGALNTCELRFIYRSIPPSMFISRSLEEKKRGR